ncbi:SAV_2336 N-terminal domain-related protein [Streptomyces sp. NPDC050619]|uniref:SAV_2336 N-terminal domain-related protein n=1 Tax=Streptomyces sp. NPDC050619 TaxID=3157214 RepID=UPI0034422133
MIERLRQVLDGMGYELGGPELLDILWLARAMDGGATASPAAAAGPSPAQPDARAGQEPPPADGSLPATVPPDRTPPGRRAPGRSDPAEDSGHRHRLFTAAADAERGSAADPRARAIRAPGPRALPGMHGLARALRPLRSHRDHRHRTVADIEATVRLTAESGVLDVVDRPEQELRHTAVLLVDDSPSMRVWQPLVREVRRLLERGGVFRAVHLHRFDLRGGQRPGTTPRTESPITFLLTDGVDEAWRGPAARRFLRTWERSGPLVVVSPLPRRLWRGTAFDAQPQLLVADRPFALDGELAILDPLGGGPLERPADAVPVPVLALSPTTLGAWARLLTRPGTRQLMDTVVVGEAAAGGRPDPRNAPAPDDTTPPSPGQLLERFRASFSPEAYRLAVRLSAMRPLSTPVIQLVRTATLPTTSSGVVAEVLLGEILQPLGEGEPTGRRLPAAIRGGPGDVLYDFKPGVRDLLAGGLSTEQSIEVVEAVGQALEPYLGRMPDFAALLADPDGSARLSPRTTPFAVLVSPVLDRLYGGSWADGHGGDAPEVPLAPLRFTVFGPELVWRGDEPVRLGGGKPRAVLAALLLRRGRIVTKTALMNAVWGEDPPSSASRTLHAYIARLRGLLRQTGSLIHVERQADGYRLRAEQADTDLPLDLTAAERLHAEAQSAQASGDLAGARRLIGEALDQLKGEPLRDVPGPYAEAQRARLEEWWLLLVENRVELDLDLGAYAETIPDLENLTLRYPLRERLRALLMLALYQSGREAEALAVYADVRRLLTEELGIDPGAELQELYQHILQGEPPETVRISRQARLTAPAERTTLNWPPAEGIRFNVLGPLRVRRDGERVSSGSPQQRALLAALLLREGHFASARELIDALWGEDPPGQALAAVRTYASRLRKALGPGVLLSETGGYALDIGEGALDLDVAQDLAAESRRARAVDDLPQAHALIGSALDLWDGEALEGLPGPFAEAQRSRLEEWRLQLVEAQIDMDLALGNHAEAVARLTALTASHPLRERLRELLMLALYRSGRQAEALAVYADVRRLLADELGVDPRAGLQDLQQRILQADGGLLPAPQPSPETGPDEPPRPSQLPATVADFTGRASFVRELADVLSSAEGRVMAVSALAGMGGTGKTTFAVHVAHRARPQFPDGQLYFDLAGTGPRAAAPEAVLGTFLRSLGVPDYSIPEPLEERAALYRATLEGRRVLVLLDNARDAAQVRPLLPGTEGCAALITSRVRMVDLAGAHLVDLDVMSPEEGLQLFTRIVGEERVAGEREAALDVVAACGYLPLAIRIAASRLAARRMWTVAVLAARLTDERRRLDELQAGDLAVKATFELGYGQLEPAQARAFRLLGLADGPDISLAAAAALLDLPVGATENLLESLVDTSLLESAAPSRYRYHDLLRLYARACAERDEQPPTERERAQSRLLDFYLATAVRVYAIERPGDRLVDHLEPTAHEGLALQGHGEALDWLYAEGPCLLACARQSTVGALLPRAVDLVWVTRDLSESGALSQQYEATAVALHDAAEALGDTGATGRAALVLAETHIIAGRFDEAERQGYRVLRAAEAAGDMPVMGRLANLRGRVALYENRYEDAGAHFDHALSAFREDGDRPGEASVLCNLSRVRLAQGDMERALSLAEEGVAAFDSLGRSVRGANARYAFGVALTRAGRHADARSVFNEAREMFQDGRQRMWEGQTYFRLAEVDLADQRPREAAAHAEQALTIFRDLGGKSREANVLTVLGRALNALGETGRARVCWQEALSIFDELDSPESRILRGLLAGTE